MVESFACGKQEPRYNPARKSSTVVISRFGGIRANNNTFPTTGVIIFVTCVSLFLGSILPFARGDVDNNNIVEAGEDSSPANEEHEFKVELEGNGDECFFQPMPEGTELFVQMEVLRGQNRKVDFYIRDDGGDMIHKEISVTEGSFHLPNAKGGTYGVCIDNVYSRFGTKVVYVYLSSFQNSKWEKLMHEMEQIEQLASNFGTFLNGMEASVRQVLIEQARRRFQMMQDWYSARGNLYYVSVWSCMQCVVIVISAIIQVYFVRRLFRTTNVTPTTAKPRA